MDKQIIIVFLILIFVLTVLWCRKTEKFVENKIILPLNAYIIKNMDMTVKGKEISNWITPENIKGIISNINITFFNKHGIHWDLKEVIEFNVPESANLGFIQELTRDLNKYPNSERFKAYCSLIPENMYSKKYNNIYFGTFNGNTRQGKANINSNKNITEKDLEEHVHMTLIGTNTNKHNNGKEPKKRSIDSPEGTPSLTFTVAHELGHVLGLSHLNTNEKNIMNATTSSYEINDNQKKIMLKYANIFNNHYTLFDNFIPISPIITRAKKEDSNVLVEWENTENINNFIIIYKNQDNKDKSTWILRNIKSNKENNSLVLREMYGTRYHLTILAIYINKKKEEKVSKVNKIVFFGNDNEYNVLDYTKGENINLDERNDTEEINNIFNGNNLAENNLAEDNLAENNLAENNSAEDNLAENNSAEDNLAEDKQLKLKCDGSYLDEEIKTKDDLDKAEIVHTCLEDKEISILRDEIRNYRPFF